MDRLDQPPSILPRGLHQRIVESDTASMNVLCHEGMSAGHVQEIKKNVMNVLQESDVFVEDFILGSRSFVERTFVMGVPIEKHTALNIKICRAQAPQSARHTWANFGYDIDATLKQRMMRQIEDNQAVTTGALVRTVDVPHDHLEQLSMRFDLDEPVPLPPSRVAADSPGSVRGGWQFPS